jgi:Ca2+-binding EF-hand superfamily protein
MFRNLSPVLFALGAVACASDMQTDVEPRSEVDDKIHEHIAQMFAAHDADGDGTLAKAEVGANPFLSGHFDEVDLDSDGQLTQDEAKQFASDLHDAHCEGEACSAHGSIEDHVAQGFAKMDANADGFLTVAESEDHPLAHAFVEADADADGLVSAAELVTFAKRRHGEHDPHGHR